MKEPNCTKPLESKEFPTPMDEKDREAIRLLYYLYCPFLDKMIPRMISTLYEANELPVMMGGEHTLSYYAMKALHPKKNQL